MIRTSNSASFRGSRSTPGPCQRAGSWRPAAHRAGAAPGLGTRLPGARAATLGRSPRWRDVDAAQAAPPGGSPPRRAHQPTDPARRRSAAPSTSRSMPQLTPSPSERPLMLVMHAGGIADVGVWQPTGPIPCAYRPGSCREGSGGSVRGRCSVAHGAGTHHRDHGRSYADHDGHDGPEEYER
jgi:hypothetical protein